MKDHISFVLWFVGLSYIALWPANVAIAPGLHLVGMLAALWVLLRLALLLVSRLLRAIVPRPILTPHWQAARNRIRAMARLQEDEAPPRWVPPRRDFGLRDQR